MAPAISALIPYRAGDPHRERNWDWLQRRWAIYYPDVEVITADDGQEPFSRAGSLNEARQQTDADILVLADADVLIGPNQMDIAVEWAEREPGLVFAFTRYLYLSEGGSAGLVETQEPHAWPELAPGDIANSTLGCLSAFVVLSAETWEQAGGFDARFRGWGFEDVAFTCAARVLTGRSDRRVPGELLHLWHPPVWQPKRKTYQPNFELEQRYEDAWNKGDADAIRALIAERDHVHA